ncbi:MAG: HNH endonuclease [Proteocatella sp.]
MGFVDPVAEDALVSCGRHCCICHKFCGHKIELHHIKAATNGGGDTFDNCIPLCFDCHAEVRAYDIKHPKGKKFTESELIRHRDGWYKKVSLGIGIVNNEEYIELDRTVYKQIKEVLNRECFLDFIKTFNFAGWPFSLTLLNPLDEFLYLCESPEMEFIDSDLESILSELKYNLKRFRYLISVNTFSVGNNENSVPEEWEYEQPERFSKVVEEIHLFAKNSVESYANLVKLGRRKLRI